MEEDKTPRRRRTSTPHKLRTLALGSTLLGATGGGYLGHQVRTSITQDRLEAIAVGANRLRSVGGRTPKRLLTGRSLGRGVVTAGALGGGVTAGAILGVPLLIGSALTSGISKR